MEAEITKSGDLTIVRLIGRLDFETAEPFKKNCLGMLQNERVVFNLQELSFVGSSGITPFIETLIEFASRNNIRPKFCGLTSEFKRLFLVGSMGNLDIYEDQMLAINSFRLSESTGGFQP